MQFGRVFFYSSGAFSPSSWRSIQPCADSPMAHKGVQLPRTSDARIVLCSTSFAVQWRYFSRKNTRKVCSKLGSWQYSLDVDIKREDQIVCFCARPLLLEHHVEVYQSADARTHFQHHGQTNTHMILFLILCHHTTVRFPFLLRPPCVDWATVRSLGCWTLWLRIQGLLFVPIHVWYLCMLSHDTLNFSPITCTTCHEEEHAFLHFQA